MEISNCEKREREAKEALELSALYGPRWVSLGQTDSQKALLETSGEIGPGPGPRNYCSF